MTMFRIAALLPIAILCAAADYRIDPPPLALLPGLTVSDIQAVFPGDVVARSPLGQPDAALLVDSVELERAGRKRLILKQTVLRAATVRGVPGEPERIFCEPEAVLKEAARFCLFDSDADQKLDRAILVGAPAAAMRRPFSFKPAAFTLITGVLLGGDSEVRLRYAGPVDARDSVSFDLEVTMFGRPRRLLRSRFVVPVTKLPAHEIIQDAVLTVSAVDPNTRMAHVKMNRDLAPGYLPLALLAPLREEQTPLTP